MDFCSAPLYRINKILYYIIIINTFTQSINKINQNSRYEVVIMMNISNQHLQLF